MVNLNPKLDCTHVYMVKMVKKSYGTLAILIQVILCVDCFLTTSLLSWPQVEYFLEKTWKKNEQKKITSFLQEMWMQMGR